MWVIAAYPPSFKTNKLVEKIRKPVEEQLKKDASARREHIIKFEELIAGVERAANRHGFYQIVYPYFRWIYIRYAQGQMKMVEDIVSKALPALMEYHTLKERKKLAPNERDITAIKGYNQLRDILNKYKQVEPTRKDKGQQLIDAKKATLFYNDDDIRVVIPRTKEASCFFGTNTEWCISATEYENYFRDYNKYNTIYIILLKKKNKRYAALFPRPTKIKETIPSFWDEHDENISHEDIRRIHPKIPTIFKNFIGLDQSMSVDKLQKIINANSKNIRLIDNPDSRKKVVEEILRKDKRSGKIKQIYKDKEFRVVRFSNSISFGAIYPPTRNLYAERMSVIPARKDLPVYTIEKINPKKSDRIKVLFLVPPVLGKGKTVKGMNRNYGDPLWEKKLRVYNRDGGLYPTSRLWQRIFQISIRLFQGYSPWIQVLSLRKNRLR